MLKLSSFLLFSLLHEPLLFFSNSLSLLLLLLELVFKLALVFLGFLPTCFILMLHSRPLVHLVLVLLVLLRALVKLGRLDTLQTVLILLVKSCPCRLYLALCLHISLPLRRLRQRRERIRRRTHRVRMRHHDNPLFRLIQREHEMFWLELFDDPHVGNRDGGVSNRHVRWEVWVGVREIFVFLKVHEEVLRFDPGEVGRLLLSFFVFLIIEIRRF